VARSTTWKKLASSGMLPSRFHWSPASEISSSRETFCSMIHFCSVVSSRKVKVLPFACRTRHSRGRSGSPWGVGTGGAPASDVGARSGGGGSEGACAPGLGAAALAGRGAPCISPGFTGTVTTSSFFLTLNTCPQFVHCTVSPEGVTCSSSNTYWALHFSQRTSMEARG
jgi:hypothetical protein